ncbi:PilN domain-containing protein [Candidatus Kaiserbacteria bacterium]|nr:PilN domain-containing protein [Candidatus Kaiserbacteria bacterium]
MANLLPPQSIRAAQGFYRSRFVFTGSLVTIVCGAIALLALLPVYAMVRGAPTEAIPESATQALPESSDREDLARTRLMLKELQPIASSTVSVLSILEEIFVARPMGTTITSISFTRGEDGEIVLGGTSPSRDDINAYRETLAKSPRFTSVTVPIGVLAGTVGSRFTITLKGTF